MKIESIRIYLRHIALLAEEYNKELPPDVANEIKSIKEASNGGHATSEYDRQFFNNMQTYKKNVFDQMQYFVERITLELAREDLADKFVFDLNRKIIVDDEKFKLAIQSLTKEEIELLKTASKIPNHPQDFERLMSELIQVHINFQAGQTQGLPILMKSSK